MLWTTERLLPTLAGDASTSGTISLIVLVFIYSIRQGTFYAKMEYYLILLIADTGTLGLQ